MTKVPRNRLLLASQELDLFVLFWAVLFLTLTYIDGPLCIVWYMYSAVILCAGMPGLLVSQGPVGTKNAVVAVIPRSLVGRCGSGDMV